MTTGWDGDYDELVGSVDDLENNIKKSLDRAAVAGAQVLGRALSAAAPRRSGRLSSSFMNIRPAEPRWRTGSQYQGLARVGPMKFWGPMLEAGRSAGVSRSGRRYPAMSARPFIHATVRGQSRRIRAAIEQELPDLTQLGRGRTGSTYMDKGK